MNLRDLYETSVRPGTALDVRGRPVLRARMQRARQEYESLPPWQRPLFDQERFRNPFGDVRIANGPGDIGLLAAEGVPRADAGRVIGAYVEEKWRDLEASHRIGPDTARLLGLPLARIHTPADCYIGEGLRPAPARLVPPGGAVDAPPAADHRQHAALRLPPAERAGARPGALPPGADRLRPPPGVSCPNGGSYQEVDVHQSSMDLFSRQSGRAPGAAPATLRAGRRPGTGPASREQPR